MTIVNRVPELLAEKFGGKENINLLKISEESGLNYGTVNSWVKGRVARADFPILEAWCKYLGKSVGELLVLVED